MGKMLPDSGNPEGNKESLGARHLVIRGYAYENSAAKFWSSLIDEVQRLHPDCDRIELAAPTAGPLTPELLTPEATLEKDLNELDNDQDFQEAFDDIIAAMEIIGPPGPVEVVLKAHGRLLSRDVLPLEFVDAELLPFLLVWLLEWANLTEFVWNSERVSGEFSGQDPERGYRYRIAFELVSHHLSEELYQRTLTVAFQRDRALESAGQPG